MRRILLCTVFIFLLLPTTAQESTIFDLVAEHPELSQLASILELVDPSLLEQLNDPDTQFTLFAPTDSAFEQLAADMQDPEGWQQAAFGNDTWEAVLEDTELVTEILAMHIIPETIIWDDLLLALEETNAYQPYIALNGDFYSIIATFDINGDIVMSEGIEISLGSSIDTNVAGIEASNGIIYLIEYPLIPEIRPLGTIVSEDASYGEFTILWSIIEASDMLETLNDPEASLTLFAPYDSAFEDTDIDELLANSEAAAAFINRYIIPENIYSFQLEESSDFETLSGDLLTLAPDDAILYRSFFVNETYVIFPNRVAKNGLIHELETLLE
jgi:transforming growth factor-beta-induced protein